MTSSPFLRWASTVGIVVVAVALAVSLRLQAPLDSFRDLLDGNYGYITNSLSGSAQQSTHCYQGVRTHDDDKPSARCFSVRNGQFSGVLTAEEAVAEGAITGDLQSSAGFAIPGLWDGHGHLLQYAQFLESADLFGSQSLDEVRSRIKEYRATHPDAGTAAEWLRGIGWDQTPFGRMPTADDLEQDDDLKGIYVMLDRIDVHCVWVSQAVLDLLPADLPDEVPGGEIVREPGMGVFCDNAMDMIMALYPWPDRERQAQAVKTAMASLNKVGLVGVHDASMQPATASMYAELAATSRDWTVRVYGMLECEKRNTVCLEAASQVAERSDLFTLRSVKLFADGALGSWGSAMIEPYTDHPWTSGSVLINASDLTTVTKQWAAAGYQVNIHAIGDLANRYAIDAFEAALEQQCPGTPTATQDRNAHLAACQAKHRFRIEHAQIIHPDDQCRLHAIGIIPSIQPTHATSDMRYAEDRLGKRRTRDEAYQMKSLWDIGPVLGSDFPVEPPNPFHGIYAAVTRRSPATGLGPGGGADGFYEKETLTLDQALRSFTTSVAKGGFMDGRAGVIKAGAYADWVVLDQPLEGMDIESLRNLRVKETWVNGRRVYARDD